MTLLLKFHVVFQQYKFHVDFRHFIGFAPAILESVKLVPDFEGGPILIF